MHSSYEKYGGRYTTMWSSTRTRLKNWKSLLTKERETSFYAQLIDHILIFLLFHISFSISKWKYLTFVQEKISLMLLLFITFWDSQEHFSWREHLETTLFIKQFLIPMYKSWWKMEMLLNSLLRALDQEPVKCSNRSSDF